jgi:hypothetical protein
MNEIIKKKRERKLDRCALIQIKLKGENKPPASENSPQQGQHDETANGDVIGNEHGIPTEEICAPTYFGPGDYSESV